MTSGKTLSCNWNYAADTDSGCVRELNEDAILFAPEIGLWVVADGMGGHSCGEVASELATRKILEAFKTGQALAEGIQKAHESILQAAEEGIGASGMGTTVVATTTTDSHYKVAWVGDSRAYLWDKRRGELTQITEDHSLVMRLLKAGLIQKADIDTHPQRHMITQCLGSTELERLDVDLVEGEWRPEQSLLLCSDGLTEELSATEIQSILSKGLEPTVTTNHLIQLAKKKGGKDNISVILIDSPLNVPDSFIGRLKYQLENFWYDSFSRFWSRLIRK